MSTLLKTTPKQDGFYAPIESTEHHQTWMIWPHRKDNWNWRARPARRVFAKIANKISKHEPVKMLVTKKDYKFAKKLLSKRVELVVTKYNDSWARDLGPLFLTNDKGERRAVNFHFNGWGLQNSELAKDLKWNYETDDEVSVKIAKHSKVDYYQAPIVLEGGSVHCDGDGTIYTTEECLLNPNRNPNLTKAQIEKYLKEYLNAKKVIWIPRGVFHDETSGHVDNLLHVVNPGHVILTWTDDVNDPQHERSVQAYNFLKKVTDAKGRKIQITKLHQPSSLFIRALEARKNESSEVCFATKKIRHFRMPASYANFYIINDAVVVPIFGDKQWDRNAVKVLSNCFPDRKVIPIYARQVLLGGGNIHCITQHEI